MPTGSDPLDSVMQAVVNRVLIREGGVAQVQGESWTTYYGQTPAWLAEWKLPTPKSRDEAAMNYMSWLEHSNLDRLCTIDDSLADVVIDYAVNRGEGDAIKSLQRALGVTEDGVIGKQTEMALSAADRKRAARMVLADRIAQYGRIITHDPAHYGPDAENWLARVAAQVKVLNAA